MTQDIFVGREEEQEQYRDFLRGEEAWMLLITGLGGIGKSSLLRRLAEQTPSDTCVVILNFAEQIDLRTDPLKLLEALALLLQPYTDAQHYNMFLESIREDHSRFENYQTQVQLRAQGSNLTQTRRASGTTTISMPDETSVFLQQVHQAAQEIQRQMWALATDAFFMQLDTLKLSRSVFIFDTCELLNEPESREVSQWLMNDFLPRLHLHTQQTDQPCFVVMASRVSPQSEVINEQEQQHIVLSMLDYQAADEYLELVGIDDPILRQRIYQITHGHALCISIIGAFYRQPGQLPLNTTDLSLVEHEFDEQLSISFVNDRILNNLASPFKELTQYGILLRSFTLPLLKAVFPELLPEPTARDYFEQYIRYPYIESLGSYRFGFHELVREVLAKKTQKEHPEEWKSYHKNALDYFTQGQVSSQPPTRPLEWYYHALAYSIACDKEEEGMACWREAIQEALTSRTRKDVGALLQIAYDHTLKLSPMACAAREYEQGRSYYYIQQWEDALKSYEQALRLYEQALDRLGQATVTKAMGDVQRAQARLDTAQQSYQESISLYEAVGNHSGQAKALQALGSIKLARQELNPALENYEQAFRLFGQVEDRLGQADVCKAIGDVQRASDKWEEALQSYSQAIALYESVGSDRGKLEAERARDELYTLVEIRLTKDQAHFVYVSASRADSEIAERLKVDLHSRGIAVRTEQESIQPGAFDWEEALRATIRRAAAVVLIVSPNTHVSRYVKETLRIADMYQRPVYPVWIAGVQWTDSAPQGLRERQYFDARKSNYPRALDEITTALSRAPLVAFYTQAEPIETLHHLREDFEPRNPYKGLRPFTSSDARDYFGHDTLVNELITNLQEQLTADEERLLAVVGPSGSGKSSVIMAGLLPRLQRGALPGSEQWVYLEPMVPGKHPLESLVVTLAPVLRDRSLRSIREDLEGDSAGGLHLLATTLTRGSGAKVLLYIDQFEELFTQTASEDERQQFIDHLVTALQEPHGPVVVLLTLRADFYDRPMLYPVLGKLLRQTHSIIYPMDLAELRAVIEKPASLPDVGLAFEDDLVSDLLFEIQGQAGALPLLQFTLDQLFQRRRGHQLTLQAYREIGGVKGALAKHAEDTYTSLPSDEHRRLARALFLRLIDPGITEQDTTRRRAALTELSLADSVKSAMLQETANAFISARLLITNEAEGKTTIEVSHEALIREWTRLAAWLREAREDISVQQIISKDVAEWERRSKPRDRLYRGSQLEEARAWAARNIPSENEVAFLRASANQRIVLLLRIILVSLLLATLVGVAGLYEFLNPNPTLVTTLQDSGVGSLRWCIGNAPSGSTIEFAQNLRGTIVLTDGDLDFAGGKQLTIVGPGANQLTISDGNRNTIIHLPKGATLNISGLSFRNNETVVNAFFFNEGTLTIINSIISNNKTSTGVTAFGGGIENIGTLTVINSIFSGNTASGKQDGQGGGIDNEGKLTVTQNIFSNNAASGDSNGAGGGIYNYSAGIFLVTNSTFSGNSASGKLEGVGGGIFNEGKLTMVTSTLANNAASGRSSFGGAISSFGSSSALIGFSTIYGNTSSVVGGGIWVDSTGSSHLTISSSIAAANSASVDPDVSGSLISGGYNLIENVAGSRGYAFTDGQVTLADLKIDPTLRNNGGLTQTLALLPGSPAIDAIPLLACSITITDLSGRTVTIITDQRGNPRADGLETRCDVGAYESRY